jgi:hypothetical protein
MFSDYTLVDTHRDLRTRSAILARSILECSTRSSSFLTQLALTTDLSDQTLANECNSRFAALIARVTTVVVLLIS